MSATFTNTLDMEQIEYRAVIKFLTKQGKTPQTILSEMKAVYGNKCPRKTMIYKWYGLFEQGRVMIEDRPRALSLKRRHREDPPPREDTPPREDPPPIVEVSPLVEVPPLLEIPSLVEGPPFEEVPPLVEVPQLVEVPPFIELPPLIEFPHEEPSPLIEFPCHVEPSPLIEFPSHIEPPPLVEFSFRVEPPPLVEFPHPCLEPPLQDPSPIPRYTDYNPMFDSNESNITLDLNDYIDLPEPIM